MSYILWQFKIECATLCMTETPCNKVWCCYTLRTVCYTYVVQCLEKASTCTRTY